MIKAVVANALLDALIVRRAGSREHSLNFMLNIKALVVAVHNASSKSKKIKATGMGRVCLDSVELKGVVYCDINTEAKHRPPPFFAPMVYHEGSKILV